MRRERERKEGMASAPAGPVWRALIAVLVVAAVAGGCKPLDDAMVTIFGRSMRDQRAFDPYENPRPPAEGSVPFASGNYPAQLGDVGLGQAESSEAPPPPPFTAPDMAPPGSDAVRTLENPVPADEASLERGRVMYDRYCTVCHGPQGLSAEAPVLDRLPVVGAFNLATGNAVGYTDGYIYGMIRAGRGLMPGYGHRIPHFDRWHIVNYVRRLQQQAAGENPAGAAGGAAGEGGAPTDTTGAGGGSGGER